MHISYTCLQSNQKLCAVTYLHKNLTYCNETSQIIKCKKSSSQFFDSEPNAEGPMLISASVVEIFASKLLHREFGFTVVDFVHPKIERNAFPLLDKVRLS